MAFRYTSVLPDPVTRCSRKVRNSCAWMAARIWSKAAACVGLSTMRRAHGAGRDNQWFGAQADELLSGQSAGGRTGVAHHAFQIFQIVGAGMQFQEGEQFALRFGEAGRGPLAGDGFNPQVRGRRAHGIAFGLPAARWPRSACVRASEAHWRPAGVCAPGTRPREDGGRAGAGSGRRDLRARIEQQLAGGVAAGIGERIDFAAADFRSQRQHAAQHFAKGCAVVARDPLAQGEQFGIEDRFGIDQRMTSRVATLGGSS